MSSIIDGLKPELVWKHFEDITKIPRPSKHEERILEYLKNFANEKGLWVVEDAAHSHGSSYAGTSAGVFGRAGAFSFFPTKVMTSAEGGMIITNDDFIAEEARIYRDQGKGSYSQNLHVRMGLNW